MPKPIRARSTWHRPAREARRIWPASCSTSWLASTWSTSRIAAKVQPSLICLAVKCKCCSRLPPGTIDYVRTGKLHALAVTTASRADVLRDLAPVGDFVPGYEASQWYGVGAPKRTPAEIVDKLNKEINAAFVDTRMKARFADIGGEPLAGSPGELGKLIADETEKWARVVKFTGIKAE
jgi:tripartite-type tricarboxylate transporter receptor subunit TctC